MIEKQFSERSREELRCPDLQRPNWIVGSPRSADRMWLDKNENQDPLYHKILDKILSQSNPNWIVTYPETSSLYSKISDLDRVEPNQVILTAGSDGAIRAVFEAFIKPGDLVIHTSPSFAMYSVYCKIYGATTEPIEYQHSDLGPILNVDTILSRIEICRPKLLCLPNPDSPTGTVLSISELGLIIESCYKNDTIVLIDEAYYPFCDETVVPLVRKYSNLVVSRTFSKAWGLAGLRVGYALANSQVASILHKSRPMYEINTFASNFAYLLIDYVEDMKQSVSRLNAGKEYFCHELNCLDLKTPKTYGNFLHVDFGSFSDSVHDNLEDLVYYRKAFSHPSMAPYSRFTATTKEQFEPLVSIIRKIINEGA